MGFLGRESPKDAEKAARVSRWIAARSPLAVVSLPLGAIALIDSFTLVLGVALGIAAVVTGVLGLRRIAESEHAAAAATAPTGTPDSIASAQPVPLLGRRLAIAGITLGSLALLASTAVWLWVF